MKNKELDNPVLIKSSGLKLFFTRGIFTIFLLLSAVLLVNSCRDSCQDLVCLNDSECIDGSCNCPDGYSGIDCGTNVSANFLGTYNVSEQCPNDTSYTVNISVDTLDISQVKIANFFNVFSNLTIAHVNYTSISIPLQAPDSDGRTVSGSGIYIPPDQIEWNYSVYDGTGTIHCTNSVWVR
jgi:hypothetical protein